MLTHGTPVWTSIPAYNVERARKFYAMLFNWTYKDNTEQYPADEIAMFTFPDERVQKLNIGGGIIKVKEGEKIATIGLEKGVVVYFLVDSVDDVLANVEIAGEKVLSPKEMEGQHGEMATLADTEGNAVGIYSLLK